MKSVHTAGLMLGMLAVVGLMTVSALSTGQALAQISIPTTATAANGNNQPVSQSNSATVTQKSKTKCDASVDDNDGIQGGLLVGNTNTANNDCDTTQTSSVSQSNTNSQTNEQNALAIACSSLGALAASVCANTG